MKLHQYQHFMLVNLIIVYVRDFLLWPPCISGSLSWKIFNMPIDLYAGNVNNTHRTSLSWYTEYGMDLNCVRLLVIACVFSIVTCLMFPAHCSIHLNHYTGLVSVSIPSHSFIRASSPAGKQQSSQPRRSASPDGWSKPITAALPCFSLLVSLTAAL